MGPCNSQNVNFHCLSVSLRRTAVVFFFFQQPEQEASLSQESTVQKSKIAAKMVAILNLTKS